MNIHIQNITARAFKHAYTLTNSDNSVAFWKEYNQKFAEYMIQECVLQCEPQTGFVYSPNSMSARQDCTTRIKQHFGVEE